MKLGLDFLGSPYPITLSIGTLRKPTLSEIYNLPFSRFELYELYLQLTPSIFYTHIADEERRKYWDELPEEEKNKSTMYDLIINDLQLQLIYCNIFDFFFEETVIFKENLFVFCKKEIKDDKDITPENVSGVANETTFPDIIDLIRQTCCISEPEKENIEELKFKNNLAKKLYKQMMEAKKREEKRKKQDKNLYIPNIISAVTARHPSLNYTNIWSLTIFQLFDNFDHMKVNELYDMNAIRTSVWGDEKKSFDATMWYKNYHI